jgi:hypothetical protein
MSVFAAAIVEGEVDTADLFFLFGVIAFVVAAVLSLMWRAPDGRRAPSVYAPFVGYVGLACTAFGLFVL